MTIEAGARRLPGDAGQATGGSCDSPSGSCPTSRRRERTTASELCLGGLIKHVAASNRAGSTSSSAGRRHGVRSRGRMDVSRHGLPDSGWCRARRSPACSSATSRSPDAPTSRGRPSPISTPPTCCRRRPGSSPERSWSARRVLLHIIAETAQHRPRGHHPRVPGRVQDHGVGRLAGRRARLAPRREARSIRASRPRSFSAAAELVVGHVRQHVLPEREHHAPAFQHAERPWDQPHVEMGAAVSHR